MVFSSSSARGAPAERDPFGLLLRQATFAGAGLAALAVLARVPYRVLRGLALPLLATSFGLLAAVLVLGERINGASRWFTFGWVNFQPAELAKLGLILWAAAVLARRPAPRTLGQLLNPVGLATGIAIALVLLEPDLGTGIVIAMCVGAIVLVSGVPARVLLVSGTLATAAGLAAIWFSDYRRARFLSFLDPYAEPLKEGYQSIHATQALGAGGVLGRGLGQSVEKVNYLPEASTDMIYAVVGEELGLFGSVAIVLAYALLAWAGLSIAVRCRDPFGKRLAAGLTTLVVGQGVLNLLAVVGLAPLTGIPLPFVSYGGSSLLISLAAVGVLLNIAQEDGRSARATVPDRGRRDGRPRPARARGRGGAQRARGGRELRRLA
jgi:cell division protein FtsW